MPQCKKCNAEIAFLRTTHGKVAPVDVDTLPEDQKRFYRQQPNTYQGKFIFDPQIHMNHFATCPYAQHFRKVKDEQIQR